MQDSRCRPFTVAHADRLLPPRDRWQACLRVRRQVAAVSILHPAITTVRQSPDLVGRDTELTALVKAATETPSLAVVQGEGGVGKSRLVQEMVEHPSLEDHAVLVGACHAAGDIFPLAPFVDALRGLRFHTSVRALGPVAGSLRPLLPELDRCLPSEPPAVGDPRERRHRQLLGIRNLLDAASPAVLVIEDVHCAEPGTIEALEFILASMSERLSVVLTLRHEELDPGTGLHDLLVRSHTLRNVTQIDLQPLDRDAVDELCRAVMGRSDLPAGVADTIALRSGGLPLAVEESLALLDAPLGSDDCIQLLKTAVPPRLRDTILQRLRALPQLAQEFVQALAVLSDATSDEVIEVLGISEGEARQAMQVGLDSGLIREDEEGRLHLRHALARDAVHNSLAHAWRRRLHERAMHVLTSRDPVPHGRLTVHAQEVGDDGQFLRHAEMAARRCLEAGDDAGAVAHLLPAVAAEQSDDPSRARLAIMLGNAALHALQHNKAIPVLRHVAEGADLPGDVAGELDLVRAWLHSQAGDGATSIGLANTAADHLRGRPDLRALALSFRVITHSHDASVEQRLRWADEACALAQQADAPDVLAPVLADRASLLLSLGRGEGVDAAQGLLDGPPGASVRSRTRNWVNIGNRLYTLGHYEAARRFAEQGLQTSARHDYRRNLPPLETLDMRLRWVQGRWDDLCADAERSSLVIAGTVNTPPDPAYIEADLVLGRIALTRGDHARAITHLQPVAAAARAAGEVEVLATATAGEAMALVGTDQRTEAARRVGDLIEQFRRPEDWLAAADLIIVMVDALCEALSMERIQSLLEASGVCRDVEAAPAANAALSFAEGKFAELTGEHDQAADLYQQAAAAWDELGRLEEVARSQEGAGRCRLGAEEAHGEELLRTAWETYRRLGASRYVNRVRATLREHGCPAHERTGRRGYGDQLSPREREVAELIVAGHTDREIADELFIATRTASNHVAQILRKLGIHSREDVGEALVSDTRSSGPNQSPRAKNE